MAALQLILYPGPAWYYKLTDRKREAIWTAMSSEEKTEYLEKTSDKGNERCVVSVSCDR